MQLHRSGDLILHDRYRVAEIIGRGSFGEVYRAQHLHMGKDFAVKVLSRDAPGVGTTVWEGYQLRFRQELKLGSRLEHPNLVRVQDVVEWEGRLYLVMEYCPGGTLKQKIEKAQEAGISIPVEDVVRIGIDVASGLAAIHALDVVHRDVKPSNILFDATGRARIGDYGIAQVPGATVDRTLLGESAPKHPGTDEYMSPEQRNKRDSLRFSSDIYALGAVLFEALTGRVYHLQPSGTRVRGLRREAPKWLDGLIAQMLSEQPGDRPWDGKEAAALLRRGGEEKRRSRWPWVLGAIAVLVVILAVWSPWPPDDPAAPAATATIATATATAPLPAAVETRAPAAAPVPAAPEPTPAAAEPLETPTPQPPAAAADTPAPAEIATTAPSATRTPSPSATAIPTNTPRPVLLSAPNLIGPPDGASFDDNTTVLLRWTAAKSALAEDEVYLVTIPFKHQGETWTDYATARTTQWALNEHVYLLDYADGGELTWSVQLIRQTGTRSDGVPEGTPLSASSASRTLVWRRVGPAGGDPTATPDPGGYQ